MVKLSTNTPQFFNDICDEIRLFWADANILNQSNESLQEYEAEFIHTSQIVGGKWIQNVTYRDREKSETYQHEAYIVNGGLLYKKHLKRAVKSAFYVLLKRITGETPPWGSLTGIRPTRLLYEQLQEGVDLEIAKNELNHTFDVSASKVQLLSDIISTQSRYISHSEHEIDLYIGIPFCTTRCSYCSFASDEIGSGHLVEPYLLALKHEMELCAREINSNGYKIRAAYMGGGTPTSLTAEQLYELLEHANKLFPNPLEWTVEAGRPDTITKDKLKALKDNGITRISVNPQTMHDETLTLIGRAHTCKETLSAYHLAREMGFDHINMDLIAALPNETIDMFKYTLDEVLKLEPESITVHTLAIKRASRLREANYKQLDEAEAQAMVDFARADIVRNGLTPYYLYRQKYMAGNLENVGYAKPGKECIYNIDIMEETTSILALGAGAITKWVYGNNNRIERAPNVKNIEQYIARLEEMVARKLTLINSK